MASHAVGLADVQNIGAKSREPQPHRLRRRRESVVYCKAPFAALPAVPPSRCNERAAPPRRERVKFVMKRGLIVRNDITH
jgi:hypothetical protein